MAKPNSKATRRKFPYYRDGVYWKNKDEYKREKKDKSKREWLEFRIKRGMK